MISEQLIEKLALAVARGDLTEEQARQMALEAVHAGSPGSTTTTETPATPPKPWASLIKPSQLTARGVVEQQLRREGGTPLDVAQGLIAALESNYDGFQDAIKQATADDQAQRERDAEETWLRTTPEGQQEYETRTMAHAASILEAEQAAKTKAAAARVILEKQVGLPSTAGLSDEEVTDAVFGMPEVDDSNDLEANLRAAGVGQEGGAE